MCVTSAPVPASSSGRYWSIEIKTLFQFELCSYPASLFDTKLLMRQPDKSDLQNALTKRAQASIMTETPDDALFVIDGGSMLQHVPWPRVASYADIVKLYIQYLHHNFPHSVVVFDGYTNGPSTKDETHQRRAGKEMGVDVDISLDMTLKMKKKPFLANEKNKQRFINLLGIEMEKESNIQAIHSSGDADLDIVKTALHLSLAKQVILVGEDTDLLVLLLYHYSRDLHTEVYMQTATKVININILQETIGKDLSNSLLFLHALTG